jgi:hypothetical protein
MIQEMQNKLTRIQEELANTTVEGTAGGGMVTVTVNGQKQVQGISISPEAVDPSDIELLEDMVLAALQDAMTNAENLAAEKLGPLTGGMNIPGLM